MKERYEAAKAAIIIAHEDHPVQVITGLCALSFVLAALFV